jgi:hypothetical protein
MNEVDKLKFLLLSEEELMLFRLLQDPMLNDQSSYIQKLWKRNEIRKISEEDLNELMRLTKNGDIKMFKRFVKLFS